MLRASTRWLFALALFSCASSPAIGQIPDTGPNSEPVSNSKVPGPKDVAPDEIAGLVVDENDKPVPGVLVQFHHWIPGHPETKTGPDGIFRFKKLDTNYDEHVKLCPEGYAWQEFMSRKPGVAGWTIQLRNDTYVKGKVTSPDGKPVADARIVADAGMRMGTGYRQSQTLTETRSKPDGSFQLFLAAGNFDVAVRVPGTGVARTPLHVDDGKIKSLDLNLAPGVKFLALCLDSESGKPVAGVKLSHWLKPGIEGVSDEKGIILIQDVPPGRYDRFEVKAEGYARWWSQECASEWARRQPKNGEFQRNFDGLDYDITPEFSAVTIELEREALVKGRVLDPDGNPVAGATVAPAKTGSGNSLTGDTRFSVQTDKDGNYIAKLPASGAEECNLIAHDGKYREWRKWANGASKTFVTRPGQVIEGFDLKLNRPATVTGRVIDSDGKPLAGIAVRSVPTKMDENRYYDPTVKTDKDGKFTIKHVRPGETYVQAAPFWLLAKEAPAPSTKIVQAKPGETIKDIELTTEPEKRGR